MRPKSLHFFLPVVFLVFQAQAQKISVLFVGNSYTMPLQQPLEQISMAKGDTLLLDFSAAGGQTLKNHSEEPMFKDALDRGTFDFVVLQEQSQLPSFPPNQVKTEVYPYARKLVDQIRAKDSCIQPMFYMTWGRENGDKENCAFYKPLCTYEGMQGRLRESYLEMAQDNDASVSPVGMAWKAARAADPDLQLYTPDESHPNMEGSYLAACVFYSAITRKSAYGACEKIGMDTSVGHFLEKIAAQTVFDSIPNWRLDAHKTKALFSNTSDALKHSFNNTSSGAYKYFWNFGDGKTSEQKSPVHEYDKDGDYKVVLVAQGTCGSDTFSMLVQARTIGVNEADELEIALYPNPSSSELHLRSSVHEVLEVRFYSASGERVMLPSVIQNEVFDVSELSAGMYFMEVQTSMGRSNIPFVRE